MSKKIFYYLLIVSIALNACEEVIDIDLDEVTPRLIVEGYVTNTHDPCIVKLSKTVNYFDVNEFPMVSSALVTISDNVGNTTILAEQTPGIYETGRYFGISGRTYTITVKTDNKIYTASSYMPSLVPVDSLKYKFRQGGLFYEEGYYVSVYFTDIAAEDNYYLLKFYLNGTLYEHPEGYYDDYLVFEDDFFEGNNIDFEFWNAPVSLNDTIVVELISIDKAVFEYYDTLNELIEGGSHPPAAPQNPTTNISNDALGFFGAFAIASETIIIQ